MVLTPALAPCPITELFELVPEMHNAFHDWTHGQCLSPPLVSLVGGAEVGHIFLPPYPEDDVFLHLAPKAVIHGQRQDVPPLR